MLMKKFCILLFSLSPLLPAHCSCRWLLLHMIIIRTPLDEGSAHRRDLYLTTHTKFTTDGQLYPDGIRTGNLSKGAASELRLISRGHREGGATILCPTCYLLVCQLIICSYGYVLGLRMSFVADRY